MIEENSYKNELPNSKRSNLGYSEFYALLSDYLKRLQNYPERTNYKFLISRQDLIVVDDILKETIDYLKVLSKEPLYQVEFNNLFFTALNIINSLSKFKNQKNILIYQKMQKIKLIESKIKFLLSKEGNSEEEYQDAINLIEELGEIERSSEINYLVPRITIANQLKYKSICLFYLQDFESSQENAIQALDLLESGNQKKQQDPKYEDKRNEKISEILELLAEIYDFKKDFKSAKACYERAYYLNFGKYGSENEKTEKYRKLKENYELGNDEFQNENYDDFSIDYNNNQDNKSNEFGQSSNFNERKIMNGQISTFKGTTDTYSFKIPFTKQYEPFIISFFSKVKGKDKDEDKFDSHLFLKNVYFNKKALFRYLGISNSQKQENYILYTEDTLNVILKKITVEKCGEIKIDDEKLSKTLLQL